VSEGAAATESVDVSSAAIVSGIPYTSLFHLVDYSHEIFSSTIRIVECSTHGSLNLRCFKSHFNKILNSRFISTSSGYPNEFHDDSIPNVEASKAGVAGAAGAGAAATGAVFAGVAAGGFAGEDVEVTAGLG
jgi:hypothetical protein